MLRKSLLAATICALSFPLGAAELKYDHWVKLTPQTAVIGNFPAQKAAILRIKSGDTVRFDGGGGNRWGDQDPDKWLASQNVATTVAAHPGLSETLKVINEAPRYASIETGHIILGPIEIEGAMPGDMLEVRVLSVTPRIPYGVVMLRPGGGGLPDDQDKKVQTSDLRTIHIDLKRNVGVFANNIEVPLAPFQGVMAVQPPDSDGPNRRSGPPGLFGGNLDCKELVAGSTLYLPVYHPGARFFTGDDHGAQGDGEVTGTAIETANTSVLQFILHKNVNLTTPRAETPTHFIAFGLDPNLEEAMKKAVREAIAYMKDRKGLDYNSAYMLSSVGVDFRVTQVVDGTKGVHAMIPKNVFKDGAKDSYWYKPAR